MFGFIGLSLIYLLVLCVCCWLFALLVDSGI